MKRIFFAAFMFSALLISNVLAASQIDYDKDNQVLTVSTDDYSNHDSQVSLIIYDTNALAGRNLSSLTKEELTPIVLYFAEKEADTLGKAEFEIKLTETVRQNGGDYAVKIASSAGTDVPISQKIYSDAELSTALNDLNSYIDGNTVSQRLENEAFRKILGLDEIYKRVSDKSIMAISLKEYKTKHGISSFADIKLAEMNMEQGIKVFNDLSSINVWLNVKGIVNKYYAYKGTESSEYASYKLLSDTSAIDKSIFSHKPYTSLESFETAFKNAVNNPPQESQIAYTPSIINSSGGGGGGGGGGFAMPSNTAPSTNPVSNQNAKTSTFTDVADNFWAKDAIEKLVAAGVVSGMGNDSFSPNSNVTREQFLKMLLLSGGISCDAFDCDFTDVNPNEWYYNYVATAKIMGFTSGLGDGSFGVGTSITREDICVLAYKLISEKIYVKELDLENISFADKEQISDYAKQAVAYLKENGIVSGYEDGSFMPKNTATRAEACRIILGITDYLSK